MEPTVALLIFMKRCAPRVGRAVLCALFLLPVISCVSEARTEHARGMEYEPPQKLVGIPRIVPRLVAKELPSRVDYASHMPPVGDQGMMPSCVSWAVGYYYKCFQENREENWGREKDGWDGSELCSPAFLYNQVNNGTIANTYVVDNLDVISRMGIVSWNDMPYSDSPYDYHTIFGIKFRNLPSKQNYLDAMRYRGESYSAVFSEKPGESDIRAIKEILDGGELVVFGMDTGGGDFDDFDGSSHCIDSQTYSGKGHAMTIVGYDDNFDGNAHGCPGAKGAFHVVNSWGADWGADGYFWITYRGAMNNMGYAYTMTDRKNYSPTVVAELDVRHKRRGYLDVTFQAGSDTMVFFGDNIADLFSNGRDAREDLSMWVDLTDFDKAGHYPPTASDKWFVSITNTDAKNSATIENFRIVKNSVSKDSKVVPVEIAAGTSESAEIQETAVAERLTIHKGWNLVGLPSRSTAVDLKTVGAGNLQIHAFNGKYKEPGAQAEISLDPGGSYWIYSAKDLDGIEVGETGTGDTGFPRMLETGWNVFTVPSVESIAWGDENASLTCGGASVALPSVYHFAPEAGYEITEPDKGRSLSPWLGYLIRVKEECELNITE